MRVQELYERTTNKIIADIESGNLPPWLLPWKKGKRTGIIPINAASGHHYNGLNVLTLWCEREEKDYPTPYWCTYKQCQGMGGQVRKGEKSSPIILCQPHHPECALDKVNEIKSMTCREDYANAAKALPATILMTSLGNAVATLLATAKGRQDHGAAVLYRHLDDWLLRDGERKPLAASAQNLIGALVAADQIAYERASDEALAYVEWIKKFAQAFIPTS